MASFTNVFLIALALLSGVETASAADDSNLLPVEQAFRLDSKVLDRNHVQFTWQIADGYYLYRDHIKVKSSGSSVVLGALELPAGERKHDEFLGDVEIYHHELTAIQRLEPSSGEITEEELKLTIQGCHEVDPKICFPPFSRKLALTLPAEAPADAKSQPTAPINPLAQALGLGQNKALGSTANNQPLPPEQAFVFEAIYAGPNRILARWSMPNGYYLYRDKTQLVSLLHLSGAGALTSAAPQMHWPEGIKHQDENFGDSVVYFNQVEVPIVFQRSNPQALTIALSMAFQGCQEQGICYPLMTRTVNVDIPVTTAIDYTTGSSVGVPDAMEAPKASATSIAPDRAPTKTDANLSDEQRLAALLSGDRLWALVLFFGFGLLLAFTPCVFPMIPILSGIIAGAGETISTKRAFALSLVYVLASSVIFTIAGIAAGLAGKNLQAAFQTPWVLWSFAGLFVLLSLSMFGFYELQLPSSWQSKIARLSGRQRSGSLLGVAVMGVLSALIVGPCVAPPLTGAVLYISQSHNPAFGGLALFILSLGMGVPLLVFGTAAGNLLPRAGAWMNTVKAVFGVTFLGLAIWMLTRILDPQWIMLMTGALLIACSVYLGALEQLADGANGWCKLQKTLGLLLLLLGVAELFGAVSGGRDPLQPLQGNNAMNAVVTPTSSSLAFKTIKNVQDLDREIVAASAAGKPLMLDFYADWCVACKEMEKFTFSNPQVQQMLAGYILLKADVTQNDHDDQTLLGRFGVLGPPTTLFFTPEGIEQRALRLSGFESAPEFNARAAKARQ